MTIPKTPTRSSFPGQDRRRPPSTGFKRGRRGRKLRGVVFWEFTDRRHNPPSPRTGHTFFDPVPFPYAPSPKQPGNEDDEAETMNLDGTNDPEDTTIEDAGEDLRERRHENGYPVTSSPTFRKNTRTLEKQAAETELVHHVDALDLESDTHTSHIISAQDTSTERKESKTQELFVASSFPSLVSTAFRRTKS